MSSELTESQVLEKPKRRNVSIMTLSIIVALVLAIAAGYYVHIKNEKMNRHETNRASSESNHAN